MHVFYEWIGEGSKHITPLQTAIRGGLIFIIALLLIRLSGRRSFGMNSPLDNVISILLGAVLSRAVIPGDTSFFSVVAGAAVIALLHRICAWIAIYSDAFGKLLKGTSLILYRDGQRERRNMRKASITNEDLLEGIRTGANVDSLEEIKSAHLERNGSISVVKKPQESTENDV